MRLSAISSPERTIQSSDASRLSSTGDISNSIMKKPASSGSLNRLINLKLQYTLINTVSGVLRTEGMEILRGPMNFSTNEECGFLAEGFDQPPILMTPYNHAYYNDLMEQCGLSKAKDLYAYILDTPEELPQKINRVAEIALKSGIRVRTIDMKNFHRDMQIFKVVYNSAWQKNWGFIPLTDEELRLPQQQPEARCRPRHDRHCREK